MAEVIFREFESVSGAILSRSKKTKVMGLGEWKDRQIWPLPWIKVEDELKIFGFFITPSYERTIVVNWERLVKKVSDVLISWRSRQLPSLRMRSDVIRIFATSKIKHGDPNQQAGEGRPQPSINRPGHNGAQDFMDSTSQR